ncbi:MAG: PAS domain S-box protein [Bacteroidales bacterium]|nr:PAS domain S-box protein [Bacteroidales bacterium]
MSKRDPYIIKRINLRRVLVVTAISILVVLLILFSFIMESGLPISFQSLARIHSEHPSLFLVDLLPLFVSAFLHPMHFLMNKAIREYEERVLASQLLLKRNTEFAKLLSDGENPEPYEEMMETELGRSLRMIHLNIKADRRQEREQSYINEGKNLVSRVLREQQDLGELSFRILKVLNTYIQSIQGAFYLFDEDSRRLINTATYAYNRNKYLDQEFKIGEGLVGQCAFEMDYIYRTEIPEDYITITSGILGDHKPESILLVPLISDEVLQGVLEFAFLKERIPKLTIQFLLELGEIIARTILNLKMSMHTRKWLEESRSMTEELKKNEAQLQENVREMSIAQLKLEQANIQLEGKITEARLTYISPSVVNILGYSMEEMMAGKDLERIGKKDSKRLQQVFDLLKENPEAIEPLEYWFIKKNGERVFLRSSCRNMIDDTAIRGFLLNTTDITESVHREREQRLKSRMQALSENSLDLILRISTSGNIYYANPIVEDYTQIAPSSMVNRNISEVPFSQVFVGLLDQILSSMEQSPVKKNLQLNLPMDLGEHRSERILNVDAIPEFLENELETILIVGHDITEAKLIEKEIKIQNRKVQDSINYAERIQSSILPESARIKKAFPRSFVFYKAKDVISGDFPWFFETEDSWYMAAVDCTGHGVPGALLSLVGLFLMNNICGLNPGISAGELCESLHQEVRKTLKQDRDKPETRDGMDMALCRFLKKRPVMEFAGAHRPLYLLSEGEVSVYKGERKAIGGLKHPRKPESLFTHVEVEYRPGDKFFFFTNGLSDQMGGPEGLK